MVLRVFPSDVESTQRAFVQVFNIPSQGCLAEMPAGGN